MSIANTCNGSLLSRFSEVRFISTITLIHLPNRAQIRPSALCLQQLISLVAYRQFAVEQPRTNTSLSMTLIETYLILSVLRTMAILPLSLARLPLLLRLPIHWSRFPLMELLFLGFTH